MKFSERKGYRKTSQLIQIENVNEDLKNSIWNLIYGRLSDDFIRDYYIFKKKRLAGLENRLSFEKEFLNLLWFEIYDLLEFCSFWLGGGKFDPKVNQILEQELSGYRMIKGVIVDIIDKHEVEMLEIVLTDKEFPNVKTHLQRALELLSDRKNPDYRNSIKESISAVESIAKEIAQKPKAELGAALSEIEKQGKLHRAMKRAFLSLYGYTSDANGIRHALMEESNLTADDAKFFLLSCTSFINYLKAKM